MATPAQLASMQQTEAGMDLVSEASDVVARNTRAYAQLHRTTRSTAFRLIIGLALVKSRIDYRPSTARTK